jgi:hypothetical protein
VVEVLLQDHLVLQEQAVKEMLVVVVTQPQDSQAVVVVVLVAWAAMVLQTQAVQVALLQALIHLGQL